MSELKLGVIGTSDAAKTLAIGAKKAGYQVIVGSRHPEQHSIWSESERIPISNYQQTAQNSHIILLAIQSIHAQQALSITGPEAIKKKIVIDATHPVSANRDASPSILEGLQEKYPAAYFVKSLSSVGATHLVNPKFTHTKPAMFICGDSNWAKNIVSTLLAAIGWEAVDMGDRHAAAQIEALSALWQNNGFYSADWNRAFIE